MLLIDAPKTRDIKKLQLKVPAITFFDCSATESNIYVKPKTD